MKVRLLGLPWWSSGPVGKTHVSNAGSEALMPNQRAKIPYASQPENQNLKQKNIVEVFKE